jgi:hypothetical protein
MLENRRDSWNSLDHPIIKSLNRPITRRPGGPIPIALFDIAKANPKIEHHLAASSTQFFV